MSVLLLSKDATVSDTYLSGDSTVLASLLFGAKRARKLDGSLGGTWPRCDKDLLVCV